MGFSVLVYLDDLTRDLEKVSAGKRLAFAAWCCEPLLQESYPYMEARLGRELPEEIRNVLNAAWAVAVSNKGIPAEQLVAARTHLEAVDWPDEVPVGSESQDDAALQCLECAIRVCDVAENGSSRAGAEAAEKVINHLDFQLGQSSRTFDDPIMNAEIDAQRKMIRWLGSIDEITLIARNLFREK